MKKQEITRNLKHLGYFMTVNMDHDLYIYIKFQGEINI